MYLYFTLKSLSLISVFKDNKIRIFKVRRDIDIFASPENNFRTAWSRSVCGVCVCVNNFLLPHEKRKHSTGQGM